MEIGYITNLGEVGKTIYQNIDCLQFLKKSFESYMIRQYDFGFTDFHSPKLVFMQSLHKWYCYFYAVNANNEAGIYLAEANNPSGEWALVVDSNENPVKIQPTGTSDFEKEGTPIQSFAVTMYNNTTYIAYYQYTDNDNNKRCAYCFSTDGITWTNKSRCSFDSSITSKYGVTGYLSITDVIFDWKSGKYVAIIHASYNSLICLVAQSTNGTSWTLVSVPDILNLNILTGETFDPFGLEKFGNIWVIVGHRYDGTEDYLVKNCVFAVSTDLTNWETIAHPMLGVNSECVKYPALRQALNSIYFVWVSGYGNGLPSKLCIGRMEHSDNPPIERYFSTLAQNTPTTLEYYGNGDVKGTIEVEATCATAAQIKIEVYPVTTDNQRLVFQEAQTPCFTDTLDFSQGTDILVTNEIPLPHLYDVKVTNISNVEVTDVRMKICFTK